MDTFFYKNYYKYFLWNEGLLNYYFANKKKEILLHVDNEILEEIGQKVGIATNNYQEDFISSVERFCANYNMYICPQIDPNKDNVCRHYDCKYYSTRPKFCLKNEDRADVLAVAKHICSKKITYYQMYEKENGHLGRRMSNDQKPLVHPLPTLAIIIYIILKFDNGKTQEWENVGKNIASTSRRVIPELWDSICEYDNRFAKDASVYDRSPTERGDYAGRILYHLPLSASTRNKIQDAIYKSGAWKWADSKTFSDIIGIILHSLKDDKANDELSKILLGCFSQRDYNEISTRRVQSVIDDFDIDDYESKLEERKLSSDYNNTKVRGEFALGIYMPDDNEDQSERSIVLLTTVQQGLAEKEFTINEGKSGTLAGYNTSFVTVGNSTSVELKDYSLQNSQYNITPLRTEDVIFFYQYDETLFIQTRDLKPAKSYIIAARKGTETKFEEWCRNNNDNSLVKWPEEDTRDLFGSSWIIYYAEGNLNGQYYSRERESVITSDFSTIVMKGGIKHSGNTYLINALPYFELPIGSQDKKPKIYININGKNLEEDVEYKPKLIDNKLIIDIVGMPISSTETAYIDICIELDKTINFNGSINVRGQSIHYDPSYTYKYDRFGLKTETEGAYWGNALKDELQVKVQRKQIKQDLIRFDSISDELYFTNLLAACCYSNEHSEITHDKLRKCISYAATRLDIDIQKEGFISNVKWMLSKAGILNIDYTTRKCQAIAPSFLRIPFSKTGGQGTQLLMLTGCYTRAFVADLMDYCNEHGIEMHTTKSCCHTDEERLLPPIILLDYNFSPKCFCEEYDHQCDITGDCDFALSLLNIIPPYKDICAKFSFKNNDSDMFLHGLEQTTVNSYPRIRITNNSSILKDKFIENIDGRFAKIEAGLTTWASIYCYHEKNTPMVILQKGNRVFLPTTLKLPNYIERALYIMNLGMPNSQKVFVCGSSASTYYSTLYQYNLYDSTRCSVFASRLTGEDVSNSNNLTRYAVQTKMKMEFYRPSINGKKQQEYYLVLKDTNGADILAVAHKHKVYLRNRKNQFCRMETETINEVMTFLIEKNWMFATDGQSIGISTRGGIDFTSIYKLTNDGLEIPDLSKYIKESIQIL